VVAFAWGRSAPHDDLGNIGLTVSAAASRKVIHDSVRGATRGVSRQAIADLIRPSLYG
jgi:hypothetical protein